MSSDGKHYIKRAITAAVRAPASPFGAFISQDLSPQELSNTPLSILLFSPLPSTQLHLKIFQPDSSRNDNKNNNNEKMLVAVIWYLNGGPERLNYALKDKQP